MAERFVGHTEPEAIIPNRIVRCPSREEFAQWLNDWAGRDQDDPVGPEDAAQMCADYLWGRMTGLHGR